LLSRLLHLFSNKVKVVQRKILLQQLYTKVINSIPYAITEKKRGKNQIYWRNAFAQEVFLADKLKRESIKVCHPIFDEKELSHLNLQQMSESEYLFSDEIFHVENPVMGFKQIRHIDGRINYFDSYKYVINYHGEVSIIFVDIPMTELVLAKKKTEEHSRIKSTFLANMSHEILIPLNEIWSACQSVIDASSDEQLENDIRVLVRNATVFLNRISEIISLSEVEASTIELFGAPQIEVVPLLIEVQSKLQLKVFEREKKIDLIYLDAYQSILIYQDQNLFDKIITNLLTYAVNLTSANFVKFGMVVGLNYYLLFVTDSELSISKKPFNQLSSHYTNSEDSSEKISLGLSISQKIVEAKGGKIGILSSKNSGSIYWALFPYSAKFEPIPIPDRAELYAITEEIIRCDELNEMNLKNPFEKE
ncbi:MAG: HAMP domain-containing sensor histidine kinase, partial [Bacteroidaceae bacterium]